MNKRLFILIGLDLPASDNLNVSTLCIVADGKTMLCARDNQRNLLLEIRRRPDETVK